MFPSVSQRLYVHGRTNDIFPIYVDYRITAGRIENDSDFSATNSLASNAICRPFIVCLRGEKHRERCYD